MGLSVGFNYDFGNRTHRINTVSYLCVEGSAPLFAAFVPLARDVPLAEAKGLATSSAPVRPPVKLRQNAVEHTSSAYADDLRRTAMGTAHFNIQYFCLSAAAATKFNPWHWSREACSGVHLAQDRRSPILNVSGPVSLNSIVFDGAGRRSSPTMLIRGRVSLFGRTRQFTQFARHRSLAVLRLFLANR